jgi:hypothetical protein
MLAKGREKLEAMMNRLFSATLLGITLLVGAACAPNTQPTTSAPVAAPETPTPTPTPAPLIPAADTPIPTDPPTRPTSGEIELRFTDPETQEECAARFPFTINWAESRTTIDGSGVIDCAFAKQQCGDGVCITYHSAYDADCGLSGELLASSADYPHGFLNVGLAGKFSMKQYWTDIPPETTMPFTEDNPFVAENPDILPLIFDFVEGATCEVGGGTGTQAFPWKFTLHLD